MYARYSQLPRSPAVYTATSAATATDRGRGTHVFLREADKAVARPYAAQEIELAPGRVSLGRSYVSGATRGRVVEENQKLTSPVRNTSRTRSLAPNFCTRAQEWYTIASRLPGSVSRSVSAYSRCPTPSGMYPRDGLPGGSGAASVCGARSSSGSRKCHSRTLIVCRCCATRLLRRVSGGAPVSNAAYEVNSVY